MGKKRKKNSEVAFAITDTGFIERVPDITGKGYVYNYHGPKLRGRPTEKDWQGVLRHLIALAFHNQLPPKQVEIEKIISQWFINHGFDAGDTIIGEKAKLVIEEIFKVTK